MGKSNWFMRMKLVWSSCTWKEDQIDAESILKITQKSVFRFRKWHWFKLNNCYVIICVAAPDFLHSTNTNPCMFNILMWRRPFAKMSGIPMSRRRLARIRCIQDCITAFKQIKKLPKCLCYVPSEIVYHCQSKTTLKIYQDTHKNSKKCTDLTVTPEYRLYVSGEEFCNVHGKWLRIKKVILFFLSW